MSVQTFKDYREARYYCIFRAMPKSLDQIQRAFANKSQKFWAARRTDIDLIRRSTKYGEYIIDELNSELDVILESGKLIYPMTLKRLGLEENLSLAERKLRLGLRKYEPVYTKEQLEFMEYMENKAQNGRQASWKWRIANHSEDYQAKGWYPFFVTLTVDPNNHDPEAIWKEGRAFRKYIRSLVNVVCKELGHQPAHLTNTPESEYLTYVGVVEHGKSRKHHHGHFLIWMKEIPQSWKQCPNRAIRNPAARTLRECKPMRRYWPYSLPGLSKALYFRSIGDVWEKLGFCIPMKDGKPTTIGTARQSGGYLCKYMAKEHREWKHRTKATRNLGKTSLMQYLRQMTDQQIEALTWRPETWSLNLSVKLTHTVPLELLRHSAKQEHYYRKFISNQLDLATLTKENYGTWQRMLKNVLDGARPERMRSSEFYDWVGQHLPDQKGYSEVELLTAHALIALKWPPPPPRSKRSTIPGNNNQ